MKIIKPISITPAMLVSNVAASATPSWNSGTSYPRGSTVVADNNDGIPHEYTWLPPTEDDISADSNYPPLTHSVVKRSQMNPSASSTAENHRCYWLDNGPTNRYGCVSKRSRRTTTNPDSIELEITPDALFNSVVLINMTGTSATVLADDPEEGEVFNAGTIDLVDHSNVSDEYDFCFAPILQKKEIVLLGLPAYPNATIKITVSEPGETVGLGEAVVGEEIEIGQMLYGASISTHDYSDTTTDDSGVTTLEVKTYAKEVRYPIRINSADLNYIQQHIADLRATPAVFIGQFDMLATVVYGTIQDFSEILQSETRSDCSLKVKELSL